MNPYPLSPTTGTMTAPLIVGRQNEIDALLKLLKAQSVVIEEFRRMGKTLLLQKLEYITLEQDLHTKAIFFTVQNVRNVTEITDHLLQVLRKEEKYSWLKVTWDRCSKLYKTVKKEIAEIQDFSFHPPEFNARWKEALTACFEDIAEAKRDKGETITLILDEFPIMLWNWIQNGNAAEAMELLDTLRNIRHTLKNKSALRFIICGSIGMGVVLDHLREKYRYTGEPFNDTENFPVEAMTDEDAHFLCRCLFLSGFTDEEEGEDLFTKICSLTENLPFYINKIFSIIEISYNRHLSVENIDKSYRELLTAPRHADVFDQLHTRLSTYYPEKARLMQQILNFLSEQPAPVPEEQITASFENEVTEIKNALQRLTKEEYLKRTFEEEKRHYQFKYQLFQKWWRLNKA